MVDPWHRAEHDDAIALCGGTHDGVLGGRH
jgi:hypothetical protein